MRLFPELFSRHRVAPVENYPDALLATLRSVAPQTASHDPTVVLLTPGRFNSAFYEHSFLADKLGVELVEASDLFVKDDVVFMRTTEGPKRVDVIYRRIDDDFLDPLVFRPDSVLGVPGLMSAYQAGNVTLANAVGTGICRRQGRLPLHAGNHPLLHRRGADPQERADLALPREGRALLRARPPAGARGEGGQRLGRLRHARRAACDEARARGFRPQAPATRRTASSPSRRCRCRPARPSSPPASRPATSICGPSCSPAPTRSASCPGGLTRVALKEGSLVVNSSQGGGTKDTWVLDG